MSNSTIKDIVLGEKARLEQQIEDASTKIAEINKWLNSDIKSHLDSSVIINPNYSPFKESVSDIKSNHFHPKDNQIIWPDYIYNCVELLNKKVKSREVIEYLATVNPKIDKSTIEKQVRHHLSKLAKSKRLKSEKAGTSLKDGNLYYI